MRAALLPLGLAMAACAPDFPDTPTLVDGPRILGVRGEPAEVQPGDEVTLEVLVASPAGEVAEPAAFWSLCLTPKPPAENGPVNPVCWDEAYQVIGGPARSLSLQIPDEACQLFGPETPPGDFRPRDADASGGYYQPIRVSIPELAAFAFERVQCGLSNAAADVSIEYRDRYLANRNPELAALEIAVDGAVIDGDQVPAGARLTLTARWSESDAEVRRSSTAARRCACPGSPPRAASTPSAADAARRRRRRSATTAGKRPMVGWCTSGRCCATAAGAARGRRAR